MIELMTICGPADIVGSTVKDIKESLDRYRSEREQTQFDDEIYRDTWDGVRAGRLQGGSDEASIIVLFLRWNSHQGCQGFQDPSLPSQSLSPNIRSDHHNSLWQDRVARSLGRLVEQGAEISLWDYHRAKIVADERGSQLVARREDIR